MRCVSREALCEPTTIYEYVEFSTQGPHPHTVSRCGMHSWNRSIAACATNVSTSMYS